LDGTLAGASEGKPDGEFEGRVDGNPDGILVGASEGKPDGEFEGDVEGNPNGIVLAKSVGVLEGLSLGDMDVVVGESDAAFVGPSAGDADKVSDGDADTNFDGPLLVASLGAIDGVMLWDPDTIVGKSDRKCVGPSEAEGASDTGSDGDAEINVDGTFLLCEFVGPLDGILHRNPDPVGGSEIIFVSPSEGDTDTALDGTTDNNSDGT
jgi:hypothetical protein